MIKVIKVGKDNSYFYDSIGSKIEKFDPEDKDLKLSVTMEDGSTLSIPHSAIKFGYGGQIIFDYEGDKYIIDDGYQDLLITSGYVIYKNYDSENIYDRKEGITLNENIKSDLNKALDNISFDNFEFVDKSDIDTHYKYICGGYEFNIYLTTVDGIVFKNHQRKVNSLPFYPFDKRMDRYGTMYLSVFAKRLDENEDSLEYKYRISNNFIIELLKNLNDSEKNYRFEYSPVRKHINRFKGI